MNYRCSIQRCLSHWVARPGLSLMYEYLEKSHFAQVFAYKGKKNFIWKSRPVVVFEIFLSILQITS